MSVTHGAEATVSRAANSRLLEVLTRTGFIGYGIVHLLFAWLALQIAFGRSAGDGDQSGALRTLAAQPLGRFLVVAIGVGLLAMAIWQVFEAAIGHHEDSGRERAYERIASAGRAVVYLYFAWTAYKVYDNADSSSADKQQALTARLMDTTGGRWLIGLAGFALLAVGVGMVIYGVVKRFEKHLRFGTLRLRTRQLVRRLGVVGYAAKGSAYGLAGLLVIIAAMRYDPDKARGLDAALRTLRDQSYGPLLLVVIALGIAAFGVFCFVQSRHRKV